MFSKPGGGVTVIANNEFLPLKVESKNSMYYMKHFIVALLTILCPTKESCIAVLQDPWGYFYLCKNKTTLVTACQLRLSAS